MIYALRTNVHIWQCAFLEKLDFALSHNSVELVDVPWQSYALLKHDCDHFTWRGFQRFANDIAARIRCMHGTVLLIADSTVGYWNDASISAATDYLLQQLPQGKLIVDAVNGSGFLAMRDCDLDFRRRIRRHNFDTLFIVGGWNDVHHDERHVLSCAAHVARSTRRVA